MLPHLLTDFEIPKYNQIEPKFNGVYSSNNLLKIKDEANTTNLDEFKWIGTHWIALHVNRNSAAYFALETDTFPKKLKTA